MSQSGLLDFADLESKEQLDLFVQQKIKSDEGDPVRGVTFLSDEEPEVVFEQYELRNYEVTLDQREEFVKLHINRRVEHSKYEDGFKIFEATAFVIPHDQDGIYTAFLISNDETYEKCLISYIKKVPSVSTSYSALHV